MRRTTSWAIAAVCILGIIAGPIVIRTAFRYYVVQKVLSKLPDAQLRLAVSPTVKTLTAPTSLQPVNLGYATFDMGSTSHIHIEAAGDSAVLEVTNEDFGILLMPPFAPQGLSNSDMSHAAIAADAKAGSSLARYVETELTNSVDAEVEMEETHVLPISQIALMSKDGFYLYALNLINKAGFTWGYNEIYSFTTPHIKGIVRVGRAPADRQHAAVELSSVDGTRNVGMQVVLLHGSQKDIAVALDSILASFEFTIDKVRDRDEIKQLISKAGIPLRPTNQSPPSGS
jgi:hypothetical protein